eukprot:108160-Pleurochrysis_carterae.AAC.1
MPDVHVLTGRLQVLPHTRRLARAACAAARSCALARRRAMGVTAGCARLRNHTRLRRPLGPGPRRMHGPGPRRVHGPGP